MTESSKELITLPDFTFDVQGNPLKYRDNSKLKIQGTVLPYTKDHVAEIVKCSQDIHYFINNYYKLVHQDHGLITCKLRDYQTKLIEDFIDYRFLSVLWCRQAGKCLSLINEIIIRNKDNKEEMRIKIGDFYEMINLSQSDKAKLLIFINKSITRNIKRRLVWIVKRIIRLVMKK